MADLKELDSSLYTIVQEPGPTPTVLEPLDSRVYQPLPSYADGASELTPVQSSPLTAAERLAMSTGNNAGRMKYLKTKFEDAKVNERGDTLIKKDGTWYNADPGTDAWELSKDLADTYGTSIVVGSSMVGGVVGGPVGAAAGAVIGEGIRTSLGRLYGTYEATPVEQLEDTGWEGLLAAGGEAVAIGARPTFDMLRNAFTKTGKWATNFAKENLSSLYGHLTGAGDKAIRAALDDAPGVIGKASQAVKAIGLDAARDEAIDVAVSRQVGLAKSFAVDAKVALQRNYREGLQDLIKKTPDSFSGDVGTMMKGVQDELAQTGLGILDKGKFRPFTEKELAQKTGILDRKVLGEDSVVALKKLSGVINKYAEFPTLKGKAGAAKLVEIRKAISESMDDFFKESTPETVQRLAGQVKDKMFSQIGEAFNKHGVGEAYIQMNRSYSMAKDIVDDYVGMVEKGQVENMVKKLVSKAGSNKTFKDDAKILATLLGEEGEKKLTDIVQWEHAKKFVSNKVFSAIPGGNSATTIAKSVAAVAQQTNPAFVGKQIQYSTQLLKFFKGLKPKELQLFLGNDEALAATIRPLMQAYDDEDRIRNQLLGGGQ